MITSKIGLLFRVEVRSAYTPPSAVPTSMLDILCSFVLVGKNDWFALHHMIITTFGNCGCPDQLTRISTNPMGPLKITAKKIPSGSEESR